MAVGIFLNSSAPAIVAFLAVNYCSIARSPCDSMAFLIMHACCDHPSCLRPTSDSSYSLQATVYSYPTHNTGLPRYCTFRLLTAWASWRITWTHHVTSVIIWVCRASALKQEVLIYCCSFISWKWILKS